MAAPSIRTDIWYRLRTSSGGYTSAGGSERWWIHVNRDKGQDENLVAPIAFPASPDLFVLATAHPRMVWGEHEWPSNHYYYGDWTPWEGWQSVCSSVFRLELKPGDDKKRFWIYTPSKSFDEVLGVDSGNSLLRWTKAADDPAQLFYWDEDREIGPQERENLKRYITWPNPPRA